MPRHVGIVCSLLLFLAGCGHQAGVRSLKELREAPLYSFNEHELDAFLKWLADEPMTGSARVVMLARKNIGQPYQIYLIGEYPYELWDADPMYCLSASDCVTFVEHTYAMALAKDWASFFRTLQRIRYKDGKVGMLNRNHFTEAYWNINNAWLFEDVTVTLAAGKSQLMKTVIDRAAFFKKKLGGLRRHIPLQHFESAYIRTKELREVLPRLHDGDVIEFVKGNDKSQYVSHMGLIMHAEDGGVTLLHSAAPAVREEPLLGYVDRHREILGVKFLRASLQAASIEE